MANKKAFKLSGFIFLIPIIVLVGFGILTATARKVSPPPACVANDYSGVFDTSGLAGIFEGRSVGVPGDSASLASKQTSVLGVVSSEERWVEVDLSEQKLRAWDGNSLFLETPVSTGLRWYPTPTGEFRIWVKLRYTRMEGGRGPYYYNLPNVPFVMYFGNNEVPNFRGYGLHGTYWHNDFGTQRSHGCINLPTPIAERLYYWLAPVLPDGKASVYASTKNPGSRIIIHD